MAKTDHNDYNLLAPIYDWLGHAVYFGAIGRSQKHFLSEIPKNARILFIGGGTGFLLNDILEICAPAEILYIEKSSQMIRISKKACTHAHSKRVQFLHGTQEDLIKGEQFDIILSFFFFDQFQYPTLSKIFLQLNTHLKEKGLWLWADFIPPQKWWQKFLMFTMLFFFRVTTSLGTDKVYAVPEIFMRRGFKLKNESFFYQGFIRSVVLEKPEADEQIHR